jgi:hypothetical protein
MYILLLIAIGQLKSVADLLLHGLLTEKFNLLADQ